MQSRDTFLKARWHAWAYLNAFDIAAMRDALMKQHPGLIPFTANVPVTGILQPDERVHALKRKDFARWQAAEKLPDTLLCRAITEMEQGLVDADLGQCLYKKRVARQGRGKRDGYRTLVSARIGNRYVFLHGFSKSDKANITHEEKQALQYAGKVFLELTQAALVKALQAGVLLEVRCEQDCRNPAR